MRRKQEISEEEIKTLLFRNKLPSDAVSNELPEGSSEHCAKVEHLIESIPDVLSKRRAFHIGKSCVVAAMILFFWLAYTFFDREHKTDALFVNSFRKMTVEKDNGCVVYTIAQERERDNPDPMELRFGYLPKNCRLNQKSGNRNLITEIYDIPNGWFRVAKSYRTYWVAVYHSEESARELEIGGKKGWSFGDGQFGIHDFFWVDGEYVYYFVNNLMNDKEIEKLIREVK